MKPRKIFQRPTMLILSLVAILLAGCYAETGTLSRAPAAQLAIVGNYEGASVTVDEGRPVIITSDSTKITVEPGKHHVAISRGGQLILERDVLVSDLQTLEVAIP